jgi:hypothetical protein
MNKYGINNPKKNPGPILKVKKRLDLSEIK